MKILQINKFFYPRGGTETYFLSLIELLKKNGHEVVVFSQKNKKNLPSNEAGYFISDINLEKFHFKNIFKIGRIFWSFSAARKIKKLIKKEKPQIAHIHNIYHQISPSILPAIKKAGLPIVMTVHDFKLIKPDYVLRANGKKVKHKNSLLAEALVGLEFYFHKWLKIYEKNVDIFIAPSNFVKNQLVRNGFDLNKIIVQPHFIDTTALQNKPPSKTETSYILFFGRLDESKGVDTLIKAIKGINIKLKIVGNGPQEAKLKKLVHKLALNNRVEFLNAQNKEDLKETIARCLFAVFPSRIHETFGFGVVESYVLGKPVIATRVGAFTEIIQHNQTGILVNIDDEIQLKQAIEYLIDKPDNIIKLGAKAKEFVKNFNAHNHYQKLMEIYQKLL